MKKKILFFFSALLLIGGLVFADAEKDYKSGKPWIDSNLKENVVSSQRPSPKDDYHLYVNYDWLLKNEIPEGEKGVNSFSQVQKTVEAALGILCQYLDYYKDLNKVKSREKKS